MILLLLLAAALILGGLLSLNSGLLLLAVPFLLFIGLTVLSAPPEPRLRIVQRLSTDRTLAGQPVSLTLDVINDGRPLESALIRIDLPPGLVAAEGDTAILTALGAEETRTLHLELRPARGVYTFNPVLIAAADHLNLARQSVEVLPTGDTTLEVLPEVPRLPPVAIRPMRTRIYAGNIPARVGGSGIEFYGLRPHQAGDSLRHINWRTVARYGDAVYTNEYEQERIADVNLVLDNRASTNQLLPNLSIFDYGAQAAAALAEAFLGGGNRVSLLLYGHLLDWIPPGYGKIQRERILRALARAQTGSSQVFKTFQYLPTRFFPGRTQIVLVSSLVSEQPAHIIQLRGRGYEVLIVSPNPVALEARMLGESQPVALARRTAALERLVLMRRLRQAGIRVVDWDVTQQSLAEAVNTSLARQPVFTRPFGVL
ncbi:MAG: DUF58 domain-containing protein [Anaerolineae bacterium]